MRRTEDLGGNVAIITGAGRGIGRAIALALAAAGVRSVLAARTKEELEILEREISAQGCEALAVPTDLSKENEMVDLVRTTVEKLGRIDIMVNNAGVGMFGPLAQTATEDFDRIMAVNARAPFILCRETIPYLKRHDRAFIVNIGSVVSTKGYANQAAYSASKHALLGMSKALARELAETDIRVHVLCPGGVDTELVSRARPDLDRSILMQPEEIADIVMFLVTRKGNAVIDEIDIRRASSTPWG
ncbi:MAG: SDR family NAD(P)-dependent oxidoreductase [Chitinivibrionales bacterium]|nr:SDR family NAD(P)-dependent oxidoreductase [Chitinivibrionales bacterium]MBD3357821.1 SDR family NAD(P)-dependent oxidoreductase [Chitinivibrionales bacterium]